MRLGQHKGRKKRAFREISALFAVEISDISHESACQDLFRVLISYAITSGVVYCRHSLRTSPSNRRSTTVEIQRLQGSFCCENQIFFSRTTLRTESSAPERNGIGRHTRRVHAVSALGGGYQVARNMARRTCNW